MLLNNLIFSFNVVMPVFLVLFVGYFLRGKILDSKTVGRLNWIVFNCALPLMLFRDIAGADFTSVLDLGLILFVVVSTLVIFTVTCLFAPVIVNQEEEGAFIHGVFRGNYAIVGLPIIANILGNSQTGKSAMIITFLVPLYNILAVLILTIKSRNKDTNKGNAGFKTFLRNIIKNPLIIGVILGLPFSVWSIRLPLFLDGAVNTLANLASPLALLSIGASINLSQIRNRLKPAVIAAALKLIVTPLICVSIALLLGFTGERIVILYVTFAVPTAVNSYIMADMMGNDSVLAANIILLTILGSLFTITIGVFWLRMLGVF